MTSLSDGERRGLVDALRSRLDAGATAATTTDQPADVLAVVRECPTCGCDVAGCVETTTPDGSRRWTQPIVEGRTTSGHRHLSGGLVHVEGSDRCLADAAADAVRHDQSPPCEQCNGRRVLPVTKCAPGCALRHAPECPVTVYVMCPRCERDEQGDDLQWSAAG